MMAISFDLITLLAVNRMLLKGNAWDRFGTKVFAAIQVLSGAESANLEN